MSKIIDKLKENPFFKVEKSHHKCPICNGDLYLANSWMDMVMDGNAVFHCENEDKHKYLFLIYKTKKIYEKTS